MKAMIETINNIDTLTKYEYTPDFDIIFDIYLCQQIDENKNSSNDGSIVKFEANICNQLSLYFGLTFGANIVGVQWIDASFANRVWADPNHFNLQFTGCDNVKWNTGA